MVGRRWSEQVHLQQLLSAAVCHITKDSHSWKNPQISNATVLLIGCIGQSRRMRWAGHVACMGKEKGGL